MLSIADITHLETELLARQRSTHVSAKRVIVKELAVFGLSIESALSIWEIMARLLVSCLVLFCA
jgi:hypothetical protein